MLRGQWVSLARMPGLHPYSFSKDILGFIMTRESGPRLNVSSKGRCYLQYCPRHFTGALGPTQTTG